jgi:hypothetical protein
LAGADRISACTDRIFGRADRIFGRADRMFDRANRVFEPADRFFDSADRFFARANRISALAKSILRRADRILSGAKSISRYANRLLFAADPLPTTKADPLLWPRHFAPRPLCLNKPLADQMSPGSAEPRRVADKNHRSHWYSNDHICLAIEIIKTAFLKGCPIRLDTPFAILGVRFR